MINKNRAFKKARIWDVKNFISIVNNDNDTNTIVYTSKEFQPMVETFSNKYYFVGPSVANTIVEIGC